MNKFLTTLVSLCSSMALAGPVAEVWPYQAKRLPDGTVEYSYDLTPLKSSGGSADAKASLGEKEVAAFLKALPKDAKATVKPGTALNVSAGRGFEPGPMTTNFAAVSDAPLVSKDPLAKAPKARLRPALHPEEPKVLAPVDAVLLKARLLQWGAEAAELSDEEALHKKLWPKMLEKAKARAKTSGGDAHEGANLLAARLTVALSCLEDAKVGKPDESLKTLVDGELKAAREDVDAFAPPPPWSWTAELRCAWIRTRVLGKPLPGSRAGMAAGLTALAVISSDAALDKTWKQLIARRDGWRGKVEEPLAGWLTRANGKPQDALEDFGPFVEGLGGQVAPLLAIAQTPSEKFLHSLEGAAKASALDEWIANAGEGRMAAPEGASIAGLSDAALDPLVATEEHKSLNFDQAWRERRTAVWAALHGSHRDARDEGSEPAYNNDEPSGLKVRLMVPPMLTVEPAPRSYAAWADALDKLAAQAAKDGLGAAKPLLPDGSRAPEAIGAEAKRWSKLLTGFSQLSTFDAAPTSAEAKAADAMLAKWKSEPAFARDVRFASAFPIAASKERGQGAIVGVARRELAVSFNGNPVAKIEGGKTEFELGLAEQRYLVPSLLTRGAIFSAKSPALDVRALRTICDQSGKTLDKIEEALSEVAHASATQK